MTDPPRTEVGPAGVRWTAWIALALVLAGVGLRVAAASRPGLWADEIFSLALATGHSLEHPAAEADSAAGDFAEPRGARPPQAFRRYTLHETPPAGPRRVVRAVLMSDTNPPFYYLLLNAWTRVLGTGDAALRLFSTWWGVLALPLVWLLGRDLDGRETAWSAAVLFALSPMALYYSAEGRMYSLMWVLALGLAWLTLRMSAYDGRPWHAALWVLVGAGGLLTHYFFLFVWMGCLLWLWLSSPAADRRRVAAFGVATLLLVLPWYLEVPASQARWRVSAGWLDGDLGWPEALVRPLVLAGSLVSGRSYLGGWRHADAALGLLFGLLAILLAGRGRFRPLFSGSRWLLWAWVAAACLGPLAFDLLLHSTTTAVPRYALAGLPAAVLLVAVGLSRLPRALHVGWMIAVLLVWLPGIRRAAVPTVPRPSQPYRQIVDRVEARLGPDDLVIVSSIPSGVIGVARYLESEIPMASWVPQLETREVEPDLRHLLAGRRRVALVKVTHLGANAPAEAWLRANARRLARDEFGWSSADVQHFGPRQGDVFAFEAAD